MLKNKKQFFMKMIGVLLDGIYLFQFGQDLCVCVCVLGGV